MDRQPSGMRGRHHTDGIRQGRHHNAGDGVCGYQREHELRGTRHQDTYHTGVRARRDCPRQSGDTSQQKPSRERTDDHRQELPREDKHQPWKLSHIIRHRGRGGQGGMVVQMGRRHRDGPLYRKQYPRDKRVDSPKQSGTGRHRAYLSGTGEGGRQGGRPQLGSIPRHAHRAV